MNRDIALITGATSGIGLACAHLLAAKGIHLIISGRRADRLEALALELKAAYGIDCISRVLDVRDKEQVKAMAESLEGHWKNIRFLINNAGLAMGLSSIEDGDLQHWDTMIDTNVKGLLYVSKYILPLLIASGNAHIINIGSIAGKEVYANGNVYCATKHAVDAISKSMRLDLSKYPVKVSAVHPGAVETEFSIVRFEGDSDRAAAVYKGFENLVAEDVADAVWYILSRPAHVNINELTIMPTAQPMAGVIHRKS